MSDVGGIGGTPGINGLYSLTGPQTAATALAALRRHAVSTIEIVDTVQNIARNLDALQAYASKITALTTNDADQKLTVTGAQYQKDHSILALWGAGTGQTVGITAAKASQVGSLAGYVASATVADSSANIQRYLDDLQTMAANGVLTAIAQTGNPSSLTITTAQLTADADALDKIKNHGYTLAITGASVSDVLGLGLNPALSTNAKVRSISIVDTTDAIASNLDDLQKIGLRLKTITQTDATTPLELTGDQYAHDRSVLGKIVTSDLLAVIDASAAQSRALHADHKVVSVGISDTANNIARNWALLGTLGDSLDSVAVSDGANALILSSSQFAASSAVLGKFTGTYKLEVTNVSAATALTVASSDHVDAIDVVDSSANIVSNMADMKAIDGASKLNSITVSLPHTPIAMDISLLQGDELATTQSVLSKIKGQNYGLAVAGAATSDVADLAGNIRVVSVAVSDSSANISSALTDLHKLGKKLATITQTDTGTAYDLTQALLDANATVLAKIAGGYTANLTDVTAAKATADALNSHVAHIAVSDTGRNILARWNQLGAIGSMLNSVTQSDNTVLSIAADNYQVGVANGLTAKIAADTTYSIVGATVAQANTLTSESAVAEIQVTADGTTISDNMTALETLAGGGKLTTIINQTPNTSLTLDASQLDDAQAVLDLIKNGSYTLALTGVDVGDAATLASTNRKVATLETTGVAADIVANLSDLKALGRKLTTITQTDAGDENLAMTGAVFEQNSAALAKIDGGFHADLSDVTAAKAATYATNNSVNRMSVTDTGAHLSSAWAALGEIGSMLADVTQSDGSTLQVRATDWLAGSDLFAKFPAPPVAAVSGANVTQVADLVADTAVTSIQVSDTADALSGALSDLNGQATITEVVVQDSTNPLAMTAADFAGATALLAKVSGGLYSVALSDVGAADAVALAGNTHVTSMDVSDSSANVTTHFDALAALTNLNSIALTNDNGTLTLTSDQVFANPATLDRISGAYQITATGVATLDLAGIQDFPQVSTINISDTADSVSGRFGEILALGDTIGQIHLTDGGTPLLSLSEADQTAGAAALAKIDGSYMVDVTDAVAGNAQALAGDGTVNSVQVADTASNVSSNFDTLVSLYNSGSGKLTGITLTDENPLILTQDQQTAGSDMLNALLSDATIETAV